MSSNHRQINYRMRVTLSDGRQMTGADARLRQGSARPKVYYDPADSHST